MSLTQSVSSHLWSIHVSKKGKDLPGRHLGSAEKREVFPHGTSWSGVRWLLVNSFWYDKSY